MATDSLQVVDPNSQIRRFFQGGLGSLPSFRGPLPGALGERQRRGLRRCHAAGGGGNEGRGRSKESWRDLA